MKLLSCCLLAAAVQAPFSRGVALLHATGDGAHSSRVELEHARSFVAKAHPEALSGAR
jgi:hypothetical protein